MSKAFRYLGDEANADVYADLSEKATKKYSGIRADSFSAELESVDSTFDTNFRHSSVASHR